jgi:hypothetical protein
VSAKDGTKCVPKEDLRNEDKGGVVERARLKIENGPECIQCISGMRISV